MIDNAKLRQVVVKGLKNYLGIPVIFGNQNAPPPDYPYVKYTVTTSTSENKGTWQEHDDGVDRKAVTQTWSITAQSDDESESTLYADKAREWLDNVGTLYLQDNNVIVQSVGNVTDRSSILTIEYEYKSGFDVVFWTYDEIRKSEAQSELIEEAQIGDLPPIKKEESEETDNGNSDEN